MVDGEPRHETSLVIHVCANRANPVRSSHTLHFFFVHVERFCDGVSKPSCSTWIWPAGHGSSKRRLHSTVHLDVFSSPKGRFRVERELRPVSNPNSLGTSPVPPNVEPASPFRNAMASSARLDPSSWKERKLVSTGPSHAHRTWRNPRGTLLSDLPGLGLVLPTVLDSTHLVVWDTRSSPEDRERQGGITVHGFRRSMGCSQTSRRCCVGDGTKTSSDANARREG